VPKSRVTAAIHRGTVTLPPNRAGFTPYEVAEMLAISRPWVYELIKRGELVSFHIGKNRRITADSITSYVDRQVAAEGRSA
jgi:excisionase family DNA binding protein